MRTPPSGKEQSCTCFGPLNVQILLLFIYRLCIDGDGGGDNYMILYRSMCLHIQRLAPGQSLGSRPLVMIIVILDTRMVYDGGSGAR